MIEPFPARIRPVWIASYPRSGNTFLRIILQNMFRLPTYSLYRVEGWDVYDPSADALEEAPFLPRDWRSRISSDPQAALVVIKTHGLPEDPASAIYVVRDGRATIDSYFHYHKKFAFEQPSLTEIIAGACEFGSWSEHYYAWRPRSRPDTLFLKYEELVSKPQEAIASISGFLRLAPTDGRLPTFDELKARLPAFFRRGRNEDFLTQWSQGQIALFNDLHGAAMKELGYALTATSESSASTVPELARSAARLHEKYVRELHKHALPPPELAGQLSQLTNQLSNVLRNKWVKVGVALGVVRAQAQPPADQPKANRTAAQ